MFRMRQSYSLSSIAVWTLSNLAANRAYYEGRSSKGWLKAATPVCKEVTALLEKLDGIKAEYDIHLHTAKSLFSLQTFNSRKVHDLTPFLIIRGYCDWFSENRESIKATVRCTYQSAIASGFSFSSQEAVSNVTAYVDKLDEWMIATSNLLLRTLLEIIITDEDRENIRTHVIDFLAHVSVDERSWKVSYDGPRLKISCN